MSSAGNDIVALKAIDRLRTHHRRFYSKILSDAEQSLFRRLHGAEMPFEHFVWLLWSIKESVYKYLKRGTPGLVFSPTKIIVCSIDAPCRIAVPHSRVADFRYAIERGDPWEKRMTGQSEEFYRGVVLFESQSFYFRSVLCSEFTSTVVNADKNFENIWWGIKSIDHSDYHHQSTAVRAFVLDQLKAVFPAGQLQIGKSPLGYPTVLKDTEEMKIPLSFAHHDRFITYSFVLARS